MTRTTNDLLARLQAAVDWIGANADVLPDGWELTHSDVTTLIWHHVDSDAVRERLEATFGRGEDHITHTWTDWPAEGDRPELLVFDTTPRPQEQPASDAITALGLVVAS